MRRSIYCLGLLAACGEESVPNATPTGIVQGEVWDGESWARIPDVTVSVRAGEQELTTATDEEGRFALQSVPAGSGLFVDFEAAGYARTRTVVAVDDAAGDHPQSNSITDMIMPLFKNDHSVTVKVVDGSTGDGVAGIEIFGRAEGPGYFGGGEYDSYYGALILDTLAGTTGAGGEVVLAGVAAQLEYDVETEPTSEYVAGDAYFSLDFGGDRVEILIWPRNAEEEADLCDGSAGSCCDAGDPCDFGFDDICDCPMCSWDASDCG